MAVVLFNRQKFRCVCFTLNNPNAADYDFWGDILRGGHERVMYIVLQEEMGASGTVHYQGYMELKDRMRGSTLKNVFGDRVRWAARRGTQRQASDYCKKKESRLCVPFHKGLRGEWGTMKRGGSDRFELAVVAIKNGQDIADIKENFSVQYAMHRDKLEDFAISLKGRRRWAMNIEIFVGETGAGKSRAADEENVKAYYVPWPVGGRWWWPGYTGQDTVIMDEFRHQIKMDVMLKMMDRYDWWLESKGRSFQFVSHKIVITTNLDPCRWYAGIKNRMEVLKPLQRRIREFAKIYDFEKIGGIFVRSQRVMDFEFVEVQAPIAAGVGDLSVGNYFL